MSLSTDAERAEERHEPPFSSGEAEAEFTAHRSGQPYAVGREDRIRAVFRFGRSGQLPRVSPGTLLTYHDYLAPRLTFPFRAEYTADGEELGRQVVVLALVDPRKNRPDPNAGLLCIARIGERNYLVPLMDLRVLEGHANFELIEDYWYWLWNWQG
jgi:hypothetical protein